MDSGRELEQQAQQQLAQQQMAQQQQQQQQQHLPSMMDAQTLHYILQHTFSNVESERTAAEQALKLAQEREDATCLMLLLQIVTTPMVEKQVRQAAAIAMKNTVKNGPIFSGSKSHWEKFPEADKVNARAHILEGLFMESDRSIRDLLAECVREMSRDYPESWPELVPTLTQAMTTGEPTRVANAMLALRKLVKWFEYKPKDHRQPLEAILEQTFPLLLNMCGSLVDQDSVEAAEVVWLILKVFWSCTQYQLPSNTTAVDFDGWIAVFVTILSRPINGNPEDRTSAATMLWKTKKWCCKIIMRLFSRFGNPNYAEEAHKANGCFAQVFSTRYAPVLLNQVMHLLALRPNGQYCSDRVVHSCLVFVDTSIELATTHTMLLPHIDFLLMQVIFPLLCLSDDDVALFDTDPREFIHKLTDPMEDFLNPKMPAIEVMKMLAKHSKGVLPRLLSFIQEVLTKYQRTTPPTLQECKLKDGALVALGSLHEVLKKKSRNKNKNYADALEALLIEHVLPEYHSRFGFMRSRACWMMTYFANIPYRDPNNLLMLLQANLLALRDPALPVQIEAASALKYLIEVDGTEEALLPHLPAILNEYFRILHEIGNDVVVQALETIIDRFSDHIGPHAATVVQKLSEYFMEYVKEDDDDDAAMAAVQCIEALSTVLQSAHKRPELFPTMERHLLPMLREVLSNEEYLEYLDNAIEVTAYLTYYSTTLSPELWSLFPILCKAFSSWASEYVTSIITPLDNFIARSTSYFLNGKDPQTNRPYMELIIELVRNGLLVDKGSADREYASAAQLLMCVFHNTTKPQVDNYLSAMLELVVERLNLIPRTQTLPPPEHDAHSSSSSSAEWGDAGKAWPSSEQVEQWNNTPTVTLALLEVIASAFYYSPQLTFQYLESKAVTSKVMEEVFRPSDNPEEGKFKTMLSKKLVALGLSSIMLIPYRQLPPTVAPALPIIVRKIVEIVGLIVDEENDSADEDGDGGSGEDPGEVNSSGGGDGGVSGGGDGVGGGGAGSNLTAEEEEEEEEESDDEESGEIKDIVSKTDTAYATVLRHAMADELWWDDEDESDYMSPIDHVDALQFFYQSFRHAYEREPQIYHQVQAQLPPEVQIDIQQLLNRAAAKQAEEAQEAQQAAVNAASAAAAAAVITAHGANVGGSK